MIFSSNHILLACVVTVISIAASVNAQILNEPADLELDAVVAAINFGITTDQVIRGVTFRAATANNTVAGLKNSALGTVGVRQYQQAFPEMGSTPDDNALEQILGYLDFRPNRQEKHQDYLECSKWFFIGRN